MLTPRFQWFKETQFQNCNHIETMTFAIYLSGIHRNESKHSQSLGKTPQYCQAWLLASNRNYSSNGGKNSWIVCLCFLTFHSSGFFLPPLPLCPHKISLSPPYTPKMMFIFGLVSHPRRPALFHTLSLYSSLLPKWLLFYKHLRISFHPTKATLTLLCSPLQRHVFLLSSPAPRGWSGIFYLALILLFAHSPVEGFMGRGVSSFPWGAWSDIQ